MKPNLGRWGLLGLVMKPGVDALSSLICAIKEADEVMYPGYYTRSQDGTCIATILGLVNTDTIYQGNINNLLHSSQVHYLRLYAPDPADPAVPSGVSNELPPVPPVPPVPSVYPDFHTFFHSYSGGTTGGGNGFTLLNALTAAIRESPESSVSTSAYDPSLIKKYCHHYRFYAKADGPSEYVIDTSLIVKKLLDKWVTTSQLVSELMDAEDILVSNNSQLSQFSLWSLSRLQHIRRQLGRALMMEELPVVPVLTIPELRSLATAYTGNPVMQELLFDELRYREQEEKNDQR